MLDKLKELLQRWKVQVAVVGGALVVATAYGTCTYEPFAQEQEGEGSAEEASMEATEAAEAAETTEAAEAAEAAETTEATEATETTEATE